MTTIIIVVVFLVIGVAVAAALFELNRKSGGKCDHTGGCGCGPEAGGGHDGHTGAPGDSSGGDSGGGDGGGD